MKLDKTYQLDEFAALHKLEFRGNPRAEILGLNEIHRLEKGDMVFVDHPKYYDKALHSIANVILINQADVEIPEGKGILITEEPFSVFNQLLDHYSPLDFPAESQDPSSFPDTRIHSTAFIDQWVEIGTGSTIYPGVQLLGRVKIGRNVIIQSGTVIGSHGFYYKKRADHFERLRSEGGVIIEDGVEIGANCTIDRGVTSDTLIGKNSVIDNLVQIGHDTKIGKQCLVAAQCGIAGCAELEDGVTFWGQVGMSSGITVGKKAVVHAQSGISKSLKGEQVYFGSPAGESRLKFKELASIRALPAYLENQKKHE